MFMRASEIIEARVLPSTQQREATTAAAAELTLRIINKISRCELFWNSRLTSSFILNARERALTRPRPWMSKQASKRASERAASSSPSSMPGSLRRISLLPIVQCVSIHTHKNEEYIRSNTYLSIYLLCAQPQAQPNGMRLPVSYVVFELALYLLSLCSLSIACEYI